MKTITKRKVDNLKKVLEYWYDLSNNPEHTYSMSDHCHIEYSDAEEFIEELEKIGEKE